MYYEEMEVGQRFYCEPILITAEEIERFAVSYDPLPIHIDPEVANTTIFEGIIASGFHTLSAIWGQWIRLDIFNNEVVFNNPKPVGLLKQIIKLSTNSNSVVLDFMAGSGTTGHAVLEQNLNPTM